MLLVAVFIGTFLFSTAGPVGVYGWPSSTSKFNSQSSSVSPQHGLGVVAQAAGMNSVPSSASLQQHAGVIHQPSTASRESDMIHSKVEELQQQQALPEAPVSLALYTLSS